MVEVLQALRKRAVIGVVSGSDLAKVTEQLSYHGGPSAHLPFATPRTLTVPQSSTTLTTASARTG
jgi:hypothetical protein